MTQDSSNALVNTAVSMTAATLTLTQVQPFITLLAGITAIVSGIFAIRYYYNATKKVKDEVPK
jgi:ABC-type phosphate transport system permease subunit